MKFVILAAPRTGSNLLCTLLQSHPDVLCHHELYNPSGIFTALPLRGTGFSFGNIAARDADPTGFLKNVWKWDLGHKLVGFKMTHPQQPVILDAVCRDREIFKIILKRRARLKTYVSYKIAERTGVWEDYREHAPQEAGAPSVSIDYEGLRSAINANMKFYEGIDHIIEGPRIDLLYEDLFDPDEQQKLLKALSLSMRPLKAQSRKQNPYALSSLISNYHQLLMRLSRDEADRELLAELE